LQILDIFNKQFIKTSRGCVERFVFILVPRPACPSYPLGLGHKENVVLEMRDVIG